MVRSRRAADGVLAPYAAGFGEELALLGYSERAALQHLELLGDLSAWLAEEGLAAAELTASQTARFLGTRRERGYRELTTGVGAGPLLGFLIGVGVVPLPARPAPAGPVEALLERYREYLVSQRGLTEGEVARHGAVASLFVRSAVPAGDAGWAAVTARDVTRFLVRECRGRSRASACKLVSELRSFLRFTQLDGCTALPLSQAVPPVATWTAGSLPRWVPAEEVAALLASCDRQRAAGRRDFAILTVLVRLGLRAGEVAALELADIDWCAGEVLVHGKGHRVTRMMRQMQRKAQRRGGMPPPPARQGQVFGRVGKPLPTSFARRRRSRQHRSMAWPLFRSSRPARKSVRTTHIYLARRHGAQGASARPGPRRSGGTPGRYRPPRPASWPSSRRCDYANSSSARPARGQAIQPQRRIIAGFTLCAKNVSTDRARWERRGRRAFPGPDRRPSASPARDDPPPGGVLLRCASCARACPARRTAPALPRGSRGPARPAPSGCSRTARRPRPGARPRTGRRGPPHTAAGSPGPGGRTPPRPGAGPIPLPIALIYHTHATRPGRRGCSVSRREHARSYLSRTVCPA